MLGVSGSPSSSETNLSTPQTNFNSIFREINETTEW